MSLKIRLQRGGATHSPNYRVVIAESSFRRDGRFVEKVGIYDPRNKVAEKRELINLERIDYWQSVGAQPSETVRSIIKRARKAAAAAPAEAAVAPAEAAAAPAEAATETEA
jgi:small subunit ribosomal protein S16|tara:strand:- start:8104 stop:8436 length:333 start_codon:yes stop_codon:yes gene_type:complete